MINLQRAAFLLLLSEDAEICSSCNVGVCVEYILVTFFSDVQTYAYMK